MGINRARLAWLSVGLGVIAALAVSAPAAGQGCCTLSLSGAPTGTAGTPYGVSATGTDVPPDEGPYYLEIDAIPASFTTTCPSGYLDGGSVAANSGGSFVSFDQPEDPGSTGNFSSLNAFTAKQAGSWLFCGYTDDGADDTLAVASMIVNFSSPSSTGGGGGQQVTKPVNTAKPRVTRSGNRLLCTRGTWTGSPTGFSYRWLVAGKVKHGATGRKLTITRKLRGEKVQCGVRASNSAGSSSALSASFHVR